MGGGLKLITFYVQKQIAALAMCHNPSLVRDKPLLKGAHSCKNGLLKNYEKLGYF